MMEMLAQQFVDEFSLLADSIKKCNSKRPVNATYFAPEGSGGFLRDLIECLRQQGFPNLAGYVQPELNKDRSLPLEKFSQGIALLSSDQLKKLQRFHSRMEEHTSKDTGLFPPEYDKITGYFGASTISTQDSAEAGRFIMLLSSIGEYVLEMKNIFKKYEPITVGHYEKVLGETRSASLSSRIMEKVDQARRAIDILLKNISFPDFPLVELQKFIHQIRVQKTKLLQVIIVQARRLKGIAQDKIGESFRNLQAWLEWEKIKTEPESVPAAFGEAFEKCYFDFKQNLTHDIQTYDVIGERVERCLVKKEFVSLFFFNLMSDMADLFQNILTFKIPIEPGLRVQLQKSHYRLKNSMKLLERMLSIENKTLKLFPESLQQRLGYLNQEVCHVLARGNAHEIKYMSVAFDASYKRLSKTVTAELTKSGRSGEADKYCEIYRKRFTEIIKTAARIVRFRQEPAENAAPETKAVPAN